MWKCCSASQGLLLPTSVEGSVKLEKTLTQISDTCEVKDCDNVRTEAEWCSYRKFCIQIQCIEKSLIVEMLDINHFERTDSKCSVYGCLETRESGRDVCQYRKSSQIEKIPTERYKMPLRTKPLVKGGFAASHLVVTPGTRARPSVIYVRAHRFLPVVLDLTIKYR